MLVLTIVISQSTHVSLKIPMNSISLWFYGKVDCQLTSNLFWTCEYFYCPCKFLVSEDMKSVITSDANLFPRNFKSVINLPSLILYDDGNCFILASRTSYRSSVITEINLVTLLRDFTNSSLSLSRQGLAACTQHLGLRRNNNLCKVKKQSLCWLSR